MSNTQNKPTPHRHAELIKAWADGAKIQWFDDYDSKWKDTVDNTPMWDDKIQYRIKPEEPSNEPWKPKLGDEYFYLDVIDGEILVNCYIWDNDEVDRALYHHHNIFHTAKEAEDAVPHVEAALKGVFSKGINVPTNVSGNVGSPEIDGKPLSGIEKEAIRKIRAGVPFPEAEVGTWRALSPGEDALVRAIRAVKIARIPEYRTSVLCFPSEDTFQTWCSDTPIAFLTSSLDGISKGKAIIDALKQIKAEQEASNG